MTTTKMTMMANDVTYRPEPVHAHTTGSLAHRG